MMAGRGDVSSGGERAWAFPVAGLAAALALAVAPGAPFGPSTWPLRGPFGAFTWWTWFASTSLAFTLLGLAFATRARPRGRVLSASLGFGLLALASFATASRADLIEQNPLVALTVALAAAIAFRSLTPRATRPKPEAPTPVSPPSRFGVPLAVALSLLGVVGLFFACGAAVRLIAIGPAVGSEVTVRTPSPFFWSESAYADYLDRRARGVDLFTYFQTSDSDPPRHALLPPGARLVVRERTTEGARVRIAHDPDGMLNGEHGYVRLGDIEEGR